jgi:hypothetical protein
MTNDETRTETWNPAATIELVNKGFTVTWLLLDGHYILVVTSKDVCYSGIGKTPDNCWATLKMQMKTRPQI